MTFVNPTATERRQPDAEPAAQRPPKRRPEWRTFWLGEREEDGGGWTPIKQFTKRTARAAALTAAYKLGSGRIHILDNYNNRVSAFRAVRERIPEEKRSSTQRARDIDTAVKVFIDGHYKLVSPQQPRLCERDRRGRRPQSPQAPATE